MESVRLRRWAGFEPDGRLGRSSIAGVAVEELETFRMVLDSVMSR